MVSRAEPEPSPAPSTLVEKLAASRQQSQASAPTIHRDAEHSPVTHQARMDERYGPSVSLSVGIAAEPAPVVPTQASIPAFFFPTFFSFCFLFSVRR